MVPQAKCPTGKRRYFTKVDAEKALEALVAEGLEHPAKLAKLTTYIGRSCCGAWHVGHNYKPIAFRTARRGKHRRPDMRSFGNPQ